MKCEQSSELESLVIVKDIISQVLYRNIRWPNKCSATEPRLMNMISGVPTRDHLNDVKNRKELFREEWWMRLKKCYIDGGSGGGGIDVDGLVYFSLVARQFVSSP